MKSIHWAWPLLICAGCAGEKAAELDGVEEGVQRSTRALEPLPPASPVEEVTYSSVSLLPDPTQILPASGVPDQDARFQVFLSRTGRYVTFSSDASNLVRQDTNATTDVFRADRSNGRIVRVSVGDSGEELSGKHVGVAASDNGCKVAFITLSPDSSETWRQHGRLRVWDCGTHTSLEVEPDVVLPSTLTPTEFDRGGASFSSDGSWLAFGATLLNLDTFARTQLPISSASWAPATSFVTGNGDRVLFEDFFGSPLGVKAYEVATGNVRLLWGATGDFDITSFRQLQDTSRGGRVFAFDSFFYPALSVEYWANAFVANLDTGSGATALGGSERG
ncbi:MAG: hypothetical protein ACOY0T_10200 [Myxococcota bacterium]